MHWIIAANMYDAPIRAHDALDSHTAMSSQALGSATKQAGILDILFGQTGLYQDLRTRATL